MEILQSPPSTNATPVSTLLHPSQRGPPSTSKTTPVHRNINQPSLTQSLVTPLQPRGQEPPLRLRILSQEQARPQFVGKCPRRRQLNLQEEDLESPGCSSCKRLKEEVQSLRARLSAYETQTDQDPPRPGKVSAQIANLFKMIELSPGSGNYVYDKHIDQAVARKSPTSCVAFLVNCFYTNTEMAGMNLTEPNGKPSPDKSIIDSILAFTMKKHTGTSSAMLKASLRNKFSANNSRASK